MKTTLFEHINSVVRKIKNGYDDVATLTPDIEGIPYNLSNVIQIAGPLFCGAKKNDDVVVTISVDGCYNHVPDVARKFGFAKQEDNSSGIFKCYNWSDIDNIACEVEEIIISLLGETIANSFVSDEVFIAIMEKQQAQLNSQAKAQRIKYNVLGMLIAVVIMVITFAVLLLFT